MIYDLVLLSNQVSLVLLYIALRVDQVLVLHVLVQLSVLADHVVLLLGYKQLQSFHYSIVH